MRAHTWVLAVLVVLLARDAGAALPSPHDREAGKARASIVVIARIQRTELDPPDDERGASRVATFDVLKALKGGEAVVQRPDGRGPCFPFLAVRRSVWATGGYTIRPRPDQLVLLFLEPVDGQPGRYEVAAENFGFVPLDEETGRPDESEGARELADLEEMEARHERIRAEKEGTEPAPVDDEVALEPELRQRLDDYYAACEEFVSGPNGPPRRRDPISVRGPWKLEYKAHEGRTLRYIETTSGRERRGFNLLECTSHWEYPSVPPEVEDCVVALETRIPLAASGPGPMEWKAPSLPTRTEQLVPAAEEELLPWRYDRDMAVLADRTDYTWTGQATMIEGFAQPAGLQRRMFTRSGAIYEPPSSRMITMPQALHLAEKEPLLSRGPVRVGETWTRTVRASTPTPLSRLSDVQVTGKLEKLLPLRVTADDGQHLDRLLALVSFRCEVGGDRVLEGATAKTWQAPEGAVWEEHVLTTGTILLDIEAGAILHQQAETVLRVEIRHEAEVLKTTEMRYRYEKHVLNVGISEDPDTAPYRTFLDPAANATVEP